MDVKEQHKKVPAIGVVYFSQTRHTEQLATAIIKGIQSVGAARVVEHKITGDEISAGCFHNDALFKQLTDCEAIAFGSPTYMGNVAAQFKAFADSSGVLWEDQLWADKLAIGFTCGTGINGEQSCALQALFTLAAQHGMIWLGVDKHAGGKEGLNRMGSQIGIAACVTDGIHPTDLATAEYLGQRLAKFVQKLDD